MAKLKQKLLFCCCVYTFFNYIFGFSRHIIRTSKCFCCCCVAIVLVLLLLIHNIKYILVLVTNILTQLIVQAKFRNFLVFTKLLHKICSIFRCCYVSLQRLKFFSNLIWFRQIILENERKQKELNTQKERMEGRGV